MPIAVPEGYTSADVIDRRNGQTPTIADRVRDLIIKVRNDYQDSFNKDTTAPPLDDEAAARIHVKVTKMLGGDSE